MELVLALMLVLWVFGLLGDFLAIVFKVVGMVAVPAIILLLLTAYQAMI